MRLANTSVSLPGCPVAVVQSRIVAGINDSVEGDILNFVPALHQFKAPKQIDLIRATDIGNRGDHSVCGGPADRCQHGWYVLWIHQDDIDRVFITKALDTLAKRRNRLVVRRRIVLLALPDRVGAELPDYQPRLLDNHVAIHAVAFLWCLLTPHSAVDYVDPGVRILVP